MKFEGFGTISKADILKEKSLYVHNYKLELHKRSNYYGQIYSGRWRIDKHIPE